MFTLSDHKVSLVSKVLELLKIRSWHGRLVTTDDLILIRINAKDASRAFHTWLPPRTPSLPSTFRMYLFASRQLRVECWVIWKLGERFGVGGCSPWVLETRLWVVHNKRRDIYWHLVHVEFCTSDLSLKSVSPQCICGFGSGNSRKS